ncbi:pyridoxal phosphate-dependent transferase [Sparassis latifolia]
MRSPKAEWASNTGVAFRLSHGIEITTRPPIPQAYEWAAAYVPTADRPLLDMSQGVPGVSPPKLLLDALGATSSSPMSCGYVGNVGELSLRLAVVEDIKQKYGADADVTPDDLAITAGCNLAFVSVAIALADAGDEMILPVPWYSPVSLETSPEDGFMPSPERCAALITPKTKAIVLTGAVYPPSLIRAFADVAAAHNVALIIDETYRDFILSGAPHDLFLPRPSRPSWRSTFIHLYSFSKAYAIPGHRLGMICAAPALITAVSIALDTIQICAPRPPQLALAPLLPTLRPFVQETARAVAHRHTLFKAALPQHWKIGSQGGYYAFVRHPFRGRRATEVCQRLAKERGVVCLPAGIFAPKIEDCSAGEDEERWIRFSVANVNDQKVKLVCERLEESEVMFGWELDT